LYKTTDEKYFLEKSIAKKYLKVLYAFLFVKGKKCIKNFFKDVLYYYNIRYNNMSENSSLPQIPPSLSNKATLEYLTNPYYQNVLNARNKKNTFIKKDDEVDKKDISFYRKRIVALTKDMLKGIEPPFPNNNIKKIYEDYVKNLINYFKIIDRKDILQDQYDKVIIEDDTSMNPIDANSIEDINDALKQIETINYEKADELMMKKTIRVSNLDDFVVILKNENEKNDRIIPIKKEIDLKTSNLKTKGIKVKSKK
jgi:hypothetical protein